MSIKSNSILSPSPLPSSFSSSSRLRIVSWNVNSLPALLPSADSSLVLDRATNTVVSSFDSLLEYFQCDIICFQEVKLSRANLVTNPRVGFFKCFESFYSLCRSSSAPGRHGVATFTRSGIATPVAAEEGFTGSFPSHSNSSGSINGSIGGFHRLHGSDSEFSSLDLRELDLEGRALLTDHGEFVLINVYCPAVRDEKRMEFKIRFHRALELRVLGLRELGRKVIVAGDINIAAEKIDHCEPDKFERDYGLVFDEHPCRMWLKRILRSSSQNSDKKSTAVADQYQSVGSSSGFMVDLFRHFHPNEVGAFTCWNTLINARAGNQGTRLDYFLVSDELADSNSFADCRLLTSILGSDHCPILAEFSDGMKEKLQIPAIGSLPSLSTKFMPELSGRQQTLKAAFALASRASSGSGLNSSKTESDLLTQMESPIVLNNGQIRTDDSSLAHQKRRLPISSAPSKLAKTSSNSMTNFFQPLSKPESSPVKATAKPVIPTIPSAAISVVSDNSVDSSDSSIPAEIEFLAAHNSAAASQTAWRSLLSQSVISVSCPAHGVPAKLFTVNKRGPNQNRQFFSCSIPPPQRCKFFLWHSEAKKSNK